MPAPRAREVIRTGPASFSKTAQSIFESTISDHPDGPSFVSWLGMLDAYLGRKEEALRESRRANDLDAVNEAIERARYLTNLAQVYVLTVETEKAVTLLGQLLGTPAAEGIGFHPITLPQLQGWKWASLRSNPHFQKILAAPEPKTVY